MSVSLMESDAQQARSTRHHELRSGPDLGISDKGDCAPIADKGISGAYRRDRVGPGKPPVGSMHISTSIGCATHTVHSGFALTSHRETQDHQIFINVSAGNDSES